MLATQILKQNGWCRDIHLLGVREKVIINMFTEDLLVKSLQDDNKFWYQSWAEEKRITLLQHFSINMRTLNFKGWLAGIASISVRFGSKELQGDKWSN